MPNCGRGNRVDFWAMTERLDRALVARGLAPSRARAQALLAAGAVTVDGAPETRAARKVAGAARLALTHDPLPYVSRGALKLAGALDAFGLTPAGDCLDLGASTGGFTELLLERGAARVFAVDVGRDQLAPHLRSDPRVVVMEGVHARDLRDLPPLRMIVADLSFISLTKALPVPLRFAAPGAQAVVLVKPQFELGPGRVGKGGIVRDPEARQEAIDNIADFFAAQGWQVRGTCPSPIQGGDGNHEFLLWAVAP